LRKNLAAIFITPSSWGSQRAGYLLHQLGRITKAAETKAKKVEKALAEATQKQARREQAVVERLDEICMSVGSMCFVLSLCLAKVTSVDMLCLAYLYFCNAAEKIGEVWKLRQESAKDPLLER
jgi:hypothetical protein